MNKSILLGLLLMPCLAHTMCEPSVTKHGDGSTIIYIRGDKAAKREQTLVGITYASGVACAGTILYTRKDRAAHEMFDDLKDAYDRQQIDKGE